MKELRAYYFGNMYLKLIQQGIQALHATARMFVKYQHHEPVYRETISMLYDWAENHETVILMDGGYAENVYNLIDFFRREDNIYPWHDFYESKAALDGALTCVGIVLPDKIFDTAKKIRERTYTLEGVKLLKGVPDSSEALTDWDLGMIERLNMFGLAK